MTKEDAFIAAVEHLGGDPADSELQIYFRAVTGGSWEDFAAARKYWQTQGYRIADVGNAKTAPMLAGTLGKVSLTSAGRQYVVDRGLSVELAKAERASGVTHRFQSLIKAEGWQIGGQQGVLDGKGFVTLTRTPGGPETRLDVTGFLSLAEWMDFYRKANAPATPEPRPDMSAESTKE